MMHSSASPPWHSGHPARTGVACHGFWPQLSARRTPFSWERLDFAADLFGLGPAIFAAIDMLLGVGDGRVLIGPGEADFDLGKQRAIDEQRFQIGPPDPRVPQSAAGFEGFDVKAIVMECHFVSSLTARSKAAIRERSCEAVHTARSFLPGLPACAAGATRACMIQ